MLIQRIAQPPAAEYTPHLSIYYYILNPQWQPGVAAGTDRRSLYRASQYYGDRHHLKRVWGHAPSCGVTWIQLHTLTQIHTRAQTCWESFTSGCQPVCVSWWVFTARTAKRFRPGMGRQGGGGRKWEVLEYLCEMCLCWYSARTSSTLYEPRREPSPVINDRYGFSSAKYFSHKG